MNMTPTPRAADILVAASDASSREKSAAAYRCDGTDDEVQINLAIDEMHDLNGGDVVLSTGIHKVNPAAGQKEVEGTGDFIGGNRASTIVVGSDYSDFAVGDMVQISGGLRAGTNTLEDDHVEGIYTVKSITADGINSTLVLNVYADIGVTWVGAAYHKQHYAIRLKEAVTLRGQGIYRPYLQMATAAGGTYGCDCIHVRSVAENGGFARLEALFLDGNYANQTGSVGTSNGVVIGYGNLDYCMRDVFIGSCNGAGMIDDHGWGHLSYGNNIVEWCRGEGISYQGNSADLSDAKVMANVGPGIILRRATYTRIRGCLIGGGTGGVEMQIRGGGENHMADCRMRGQEGTTASFGYVKQGGASGKTCQGNCFENLMIKPPSGSIVAEFDGSACHNYISGSLLKAAATMVPVTETSGCQNNTWAFRSTRSDLGSYLEDNRYNDGVYNASGITIHQGVPVIYKEGAIQSSIDQVASDNDPYFAGVAAISMASTGYGMMTTKGHALAYIDGSHVDGQIQIGDFLAVWYVSGTSSLKKAVTGDTVVGKSLVQRLGGRQVQPVLLYERPFVMV